LKTYITPPLKGPVFQQWLFIMWTTWRGQNAWSYTSTLRYVFMA